MISLDRILTTRKSMFNTKTPRRPVAVSSMSSLDSSASAHDTAREQATSVPETSNIIASSSTLSSMIPSPSLTSSISPYKEPSSSNPPGLSSRPSGMLLSASVPIISRAAATVPAPAPAPNNNTVAEFIFQLTKMLTDDNREVIEWANGKSATWLERDPCLLTTSSPLSFRSNQCARSTQVSQQCPAQVFSTLKVCVVSKTAELLRIP